MNITNRLAITVTIFASLGLLGLLFPSVGATLPSIERHFSVTISSSGLASTLVQLGYAMFCLIGALLFDRFEKRKILVFGALLYFVAGITMRAAPTWNSALPLFFFAGIGSGLIFISSNTLIIDMYPERRGTFLNLHHTFFAFGSLTAPLIVSGFYTRGFHWSTIFLFIGITALIIAVMLGSSDIRRHVHTEHRQEFSRPKTGRLEKYAFLLKQRPLHLILFTAFLSIGVQFGIIYLLVSYLVHARGLPVPSASFVLSCYFVLLLFGRLICSYLVTKLKNSSVILMLLTLLTISLTVGWLTTGMLSYTMFALTGLACSGIMPTLLSLTSKILHQEVMDGALGLLAMTGGFGGMIVVSIISSAAETIGLHLAFLLLIALSAAVMIIFFLRGRNFSH